MIFKKFGIDNSEFTDEDIELVKENLLKNEKLLHFFKSLVLCHTVNATLNQKNEIVYHAPSIDEGAFINATSKFGATLISTSPKKIEIDILGKREEYEILSVN